jgi:glycosyltransferase involved in cell wall biosynthesis
MNILLAIDSLRPGGKERQLAQLLRGLKGRGDLRLELVITRPEIGYPEVRQLDIPIHVIQRKSKWDVGAFKRFFSIARAFKPDVIHTWDPITTIIALPAVKRHGIKLVNESIRHALPIRRFSKLWWLARTLFPLSDIVVANSLAGLSTYGLIPSSRAVCIYNGFDPQRAAIYEPAESVRSRLGIETPLVVGMVANFVDAKDYRTFLEAATAISRTRDDVSFVCVGDGPILPEMKETIPVELRGRILFAGGQQAVEAIVNVFDIGVLTCNTNGHAEGLSNAIMEYMGLAKPVVATDSGGNKEIVVQDRTGFLIPPFDAGALESMLRILLNDKSLRVAMGEAGKRRILEVFSMKNLVNSHLDIYKRITS